MLMHYSAMENFAKIQNNIDQAQYYLDKRSRLNTNINQYLWDAENGLFFDYDYQKKERNVIRTIFSTFPLSTGLCSPNQQQQIINHLQNSQEYNTPIPFPTVARNDPNFQKDTWRGPVWINTAWVSLQGLLSCSDSIIAGDMAYRLVKGVYETFQNCGSFYEFYDPDQPNLSALNRKKGNIMKKITLGDKPISNFCGWTSLINTILLENILGYHRYQNQITFEPHIPSHWVDNSIMVTIPQFKEKIIYKISKNQDLLIEIYENSAENHLIGRYSGNNHSKLIIAEKNSAN
jgi:neutral trehalase